MDTPSVPEFGLKRENEERRDGGCAVVYDPVTSRYAVGKRDSDSIYWLFSGGVDPDEGIQEGILREVREESGLHDFKYVEKIAEAIAHYHNHAKNVNRYAFATCLLVVLNSRDLVETHLEAHEDFVLTWVTAGEVFKNWNEWEKKNADHAHGVDHWIYFFEKAVARLKELGYEASGT